MRLTNGPNPVKNNGVIFLPLTAPLPTKLSLLFLTHVFLLLMFLLPMVCARDGIQILHLRCYFWLGILFI
jgi:hypothetical protein